MAKKSPRVWMHEAVWAPSRALSAEDYAQFEAETGVCFSQAQKQRIDDAIFRASVVDAAFSRAGRPLTANVLTLIDAVIRASRSTDAQLLEAIDPILNPQSAAGIAAKRILESEAAPDNELAEFLAGSIGEAPPSPIGKINLQALTADGARELAERLSVWREQNVDDPGGGRPLAHRRQRILVETMWDMFEAATGEFPTASYDDNYNRGLTGRFGLFIRTFLHLMDRFLDPLGTRDGHAWMILDREIYSLIRHEREARAAAERESPAA